MVATSITSFWLPTNAWPARIILSATILLTITTTSLQVYNEIPSNDIASLYWWLWVCQFITYMTLIEYVFALAWYSFINDKKNIKDKKVVLLLLYKNNRLLIIVPQ